MLLSSASTFLLAPAATAHPMESPPVLTASALSVPGGLSPAASVPCWANTSKSGITIINDRGGDVYAFAFVNPVVQIANKVHEVAGSVVSTIATGAVGVVKLPVSAITAIKAYKALKTLNSAGDFVQLAKVSWEVISALKSVATVVKDAGKAAEINKEIEKIEKSLSDLKNKATLVKGGECKKIYEGTEGWWKEFLKGIEKSPGSLLERWGGPTVNVFLFRDTGAGFKYAEVLTYKDSSWIVQNSRVLQHWTGALVKGKPNYCTDNPSYRPFLLGGKKIPEKERKPLMCTARVSVG
ncbi:hypothetical protein [Streptomyces aureoversilis]|uniref:Uncharacterized protein n=1 Tax=Streptomyces aureoversilis TaxID=67277 RepID=A0ABW0AD87_9ACTN